LLSLKSMAAALREPRPDGAGSAGGSAAGKLGALLGGVILSKVLGLARELLLAFAFGTSFIVDAFRVALSAIFIPTHALTGEALSNAFVPAYKRLRGSDRLSLARMIITSLVLLSLLLTAVIVAFAPSIARLLAPGFDDSATRLCTRLIRISAVGIVFYAVAALLINIQIAHDRYTSYSLRPVTQNLGIVAFILIAYLWSEPTMLGAGFVAGALGMLIWGTWEARHKGFGGGDLLRPTFRWNWKVTSEFRGAVAHLSLFVLIAQLSAAVDRLVGSLTGEGGIAALDYAFFVTDTARSVIAVPIATVALGRLSGLAWRDAVRSVERAIGPILVAAAAISVLLWSMSGDIVTVLYQRGRFEILSTQLTSAALRGFALGTWATTSGYFLLRLFNATLRNRDVVSAGALSLLTNIGLDLVLYRPLGVLGIALATSVSSMLLFAVLVYRAGLVSTVFRAAGLPVVSMLALAAVLPGFAGDGVESLAIGVGLTIGWTVLVSWLWRPTRRDLIWLRQEVSSNGVTSENGEVE